MTNSSNLKGKFLVVKIGGEIAEQESIALCLVEDLIRLSREGVFVVLCHGGGPQISRVIKESSFEPVFVGGHRVTDDKTRHIIKKVLLGEINPSLVNSIQKAGGSAVGLSGFDGELYKVVPRNPELGWVGNVVAVNHNLVRELSRAGHIPVIACLGIDQKGEIYNINADLAAASLAVALGAEEIMFFTNVEGLYRSFEDKSTLISKIELRELEQLMNKTKMADGIIPKIEGVIQSLKGGVQRARILDGRREHAIMESLTEGSNLGTLIVGS